MPNLKDYLQLHFIVLIWGFTAILGLLISIPSVELVFFRTLIASALLLLVIFIKKRRFRVGRKEILKILLTGMVIAAHWILFFGSAKVSNASVCLAGMTTGSLWTSLIEPMVYRRRIKSFEIILGLAMILGLYVIFRFEFTHVLGLSMALLSALLAAVFSVINSKFIRRHDHYIITFYEMLGACIGILFFLPFYALYLTPQQNLQMQPTALDWIYIVILAGICTVYAYTLGVKLMKKFTPFAINLTVNLEPVYGIVLAFLILGSSERMTGGFYLGTLIILVAVLTYPFLKNYFSEIKKKRVLEAIETRKTSRITADSQTSPKIG